MKKMIISALVLSSVVAQAQFTSFRCMLSGKATVDGQSTSFSDNTIVGYASTNDDELIDIVFDPADPNYTHTRTVKLLNNKESLTYAIEGLDNRKENVTISVRITKGKSSKDKNKASYYSYFTVPTTENQFTGETKLTLGSKDSAQVKLTCNMK